MKHLRTTTLQGRTRHLQRDGTSVAALFGTAISALVHEVPGRDQLAVLRAALDSAVPRAQVVARLRAIEEHMTVEQPMLRKAFESMPPWWRFAMARDLWRTGVADPGQGMALAAISIELGMLVLRSPAFYYVTRNPFLSGSARARHMIEPFRMVARMKGE